MPRLKSLARLPLQVKLPLLVGGLLLGLGLAIQGTAYWRVRREASRAAGERLQAVVHQIAGLLEAQGKAITARTLTSAQRDPVRRFLTAPAQGDAVAAFRVLREGSERDTAQATIFLLDGAGKVLVADGPAIAEVRGLLAVADLPRAAKDTAVVGRFQELGGKVYFSSVALLTGPAGPLGYVSAWSRTSKAPRARGPVAELIGSDAMLFIGSRDGAWMNESGPETAPALGRPSSDGFFRYDRLGVPVIAAVEEVAGTPWTVAIEFPMRVIEAPAARFLTATAPIGAALIGIGLFLAWLLSRQLIGPLGALTEAAESMGHGDHTARVEVARGDEIGRLASSFNRMIERVEQEATARNESEAQWRRVFDGSPHPKWVYDADTRQMLAVNPAAVMQYGYSTPEFLTLTPDALEAPSADAGVLAPETRHHQTKEGIILEVEVTEHELKFGGRDARFVLAQNVSARAALESRLRQAQKMQAIGRLAGGVAHDFNNFLTVIGAYAELLRDGMPPEDERQRDLTEILHAAQQANRLTRQLLSFSRQQVLQPAVLDANATVQTMGEMLRRLIGEDVRLTIRAEAHGANIRIDPGQFEQVLMNIAINARDAMPVGGNLTIRTSDVALDEGSARLHGLEKAGDYVVLSVADSGTGMSAETRTRIFEPFFTTKALGKGTGLGLATVYGIVTQSGGHVTVYSEPGVGTTFRIYLPRVQEAPTVDTATATTPQTLCGTETILLVEDEAAVRGAAQDALERHGYTVLPAPDAIEALALVSRHVGPLDLVLSDVVMPGTDGPTLIARLRVLRPGLRGLLMSGYAGDALSRSENLGKGVPFIEKPFTVAGLARKVREVLDG